MFWSKNAIYGIDQEVCCQAQGQGLGQDQGQTSTLDPVENVDRKFKIADSDF